MTDNNVTSLPVKFKSPVPPDRTLLFPHEVGQYAKCHHEKFVVDGAKAQVECATCGERLEPMWVLVRLCGRDGEFHRAHALYAEQMARLHERTRTKCQHCGQMTRISNRARP